MESIAIVLDYGEVFIGYDRALGAVGVVEFSAEAIVHQPKMGDQVSVSEVVYGARDQDYKFALAIID